MKIVVTLEIPENILAEELQREGIKREQFVEMIKAEFPKEFCRDVPKGTTATCVVDP